jgi:predicted dinucleotide-binding enzyme
MEITIIGTGNMHGNITFAGTLTGGGEVSGHPLDVFLASDDGAKQKVAGLVESMGLRPVDAGPLRCSRQLEDMGYLHMAVQEPLGTGFGSTITIVS